MHPILGKKWRVYNTYGGYIASVELFVRKIFVVRIEHQLSRGVSEASQVARFGYASASAAASSAASAAAMSCSSATVVGEKPEDVCVDGCIYTRANESHVGEEYCFKNEQSEGFLQCQVSLHCMKMLIS